MSRMHPFKFYKSRLYLVFFWVVAAVLLSDCVSKTPKQTSKPISEKAMAAERAKHRKLWKAHQRLRETLKKQTDTLQKLKAKNAKLQMRLLEKESQIKEFEERQALLQKKLNEVFQEVGRDKAKLRSLESKAEAASNMAEAEVALKALKSMATGKQKGPEVIQAEHLLKMSAQEFKKQNYGGALYLASQAKSIVKMGQARLMDRWNIPIMAGEILFAFPVPLQVLMHSNVREGPGFDFGVLFTLEKGTPVEGHSYKDQWVWVKSNDGRSGWIFHTLVDGR